MRVAFVDLVSADNYTIEKKMEWDAKLDDLSSKISAFVNLESFQGDAANSAKLYMYEMHSYIIAQIKMYINEVLSKMTIYIGEYLTLDTSAVAVLDTFTMSLCSTNMNSYSSYIESDEKALQAALADITDLYTAPATSYSTVMDYFDEHGRDASTRSNTMTVFDRSEVEGPIQTLDDYEMDIFSVIYEANSENAVTLDEYKVGDIKGFESYEASFNNLQRSIIETSLEAEKLTDSLNAVANVNEELIDMQQLDEKTQKSVLHYVKGTGCFIAGVTVIVVTQGAATPVVVGSVILATGCTAFGASEYYEASNEMMYVIMNEPDAVAVNPIRDTVFAGNQENYDLAMNITTTAAGLYGGGVKAAQSAVEKGIEDVGGYVFVSSVETMIQNQAKSTAYQLTVDAFEATTGIELDDITENIITGVMGDVCSGIDLKTGGFIPTIYN